ncbi:MAG: NTE family protein [Chlamydiales bacterium]
MENTAISLRHFVIAVRRERVAGDRGLSLRPTFGRITSVILNSLFLDSTDMDFERLSRINRAVAMLPKEAPTSLKPIEVCMVRPSEDIDKMAVQEIKSMARALRYLIGRLGNEEESGGLVSYLLFESSYASSLVELGYQDAFRKKGKSYLLNCFYVVCGLAFFLVW